MSQNRNHLVPTTVTNKNGIRTTVYKKPGTETSGITKLPKAALPTTRQTRKALEHEVAHTLVNQDLDPPVTEVDRFNRSKDYQLLIRVLPKYSDATLHRIMESATTDIGWELDTLLGNSQPSEEYVNDWIVIRSAQVDNTVNHEHIITGLEAYEHLAQQDNGHYPEERAAAITAILRVSAHLGTTGEGLEFGVTQHENPSAVADIIISRNVTDSEQIIQLLETMDQTAHPISNGVL